MDLVMQETHLDKELQEKKYAQKTKRFKRWGRRRLDGNLYDNSGISCKIICSECHRYLSGESSKENKVVLITSFSRILSENSSDSNQQDKENRSSGSDCNGLACAEDDTTQETDLIPHHRCPNQYDHSNPNLNSDQSLSSGQNKEASLIKNAKMSPVIVTHSKTMPDIVQYVLDASEDKSCSSDGKKLARYELRTEKTKVGAAGKVNRKWGSEEKLFSDC